MLLKTIKTPLTFGLCETGVEIFDRTDASLFLISRDILEDASAIGADFMKMNYIEDMAKAIEMAISDYEEMGKDHSISMRRQVKNRETLKTLKAVQRAIHQHESPRDPEPSRARRAILLSTAGFTNG